MKPFARVVQQGKRGRLAVGSTWISEPTIEAESYCGRINTAFNARVDEEVRKAVEEFKSLAMLTARAWYRHSGDDIAEKIGALPTEPEGK